MSCFILSKAHIDVMCWAAATYGYDWGSTRTPFPGYIYLGSGERIDICSGPRPDKEGLTRLGQILTEENYRSWNDRYGEHEACPEYRYEPPASDGWSCEEVLNACRCYEYQSCEAADWETSDAKTACERIEKICTDRILARAEHRCRKGFSWAIGPDSSPAEPAPAEAFSLGVNYPHDHTPFSGVLTGAELRAIELAVLGRGDEIEGIDGPATEMMRELIDRLLYCFEMVANALDEATCAHEAATEDRSSDDHAGESESKGRDDWGEL